MSIYQIKIEFFSRRLADPHWQPTRANIENLHNTLREAEAEVASLRAEIAAARAPSVVEHVATAPALEIHYHLMVEYEDGERDDWFGEREFETPEEARAELTLEEARDYLKRCGSGRKPKRIVVVRVTRDVLP